MKYFNTEGICDPDENYMVDITEKAKNVIQLIERKQYFTINRARQYGKTSMLFFLRCNLADRYLIFSLSFQGASKTSFSSGASFVPFFLNRLRRAMKSSGYSSELTDKWCSLTDFHPENDPFDFLRNRIIEGCASTERPVILMIDEVDSVCDNDVFLSFLGMLRENYLERRAKMEFSFQSVILAGVTDIKNLKLKIRQGKEHQFNSPWNIAADFLVDMSFSTNEIAGMLRDYEADHHTGMDICAMATWIREYTDGYPYLVSRICKIMDERVPLQADYTDRNQVWTRDGFLTAVHILLEEHNALYDDMIKQLMTHKDLDYLIQDMLLRGKNVTYNQNNPLFSLGTMYGILKRQGASLVVSNRIFETVLYDYYISINNTAVDTKDAALDYKRLFISDGFLNMDLVLRKFQEHYTAVYGNRTDKFLEENGREIFLIYLRTIINGSGNYYVEARTRSRKRTDIIVDYHGKQYVIELKIWHGQEYNNRGENQLASYLDEYSLTRGYLLSFCFNRNKNPGVHEVHVGNHVLVEAVV